MSAAHTSKNGVADVFASQSPLGLAALSYSVEACAEYAELKRKADSVDALVAALQEARRAIGDHFAPGDCYATGPLTGDPFFDLVECPACTFIKMHDAALAKGE